MLIKQSNIYFLNSLFVFLVSLSFLFVRFIFILMFGFLFWWCHWSFAWFLSFSTLLFFRLFLLFVLQQSLEVGFFIVVGIVWKVFVVIGLNHLGLWFGWGFGWGSYFFLAIIIFFAALLFDFTVTLFSFNCSQFLHHDFIMVITRHAVWPWAQS